MKKFTEIFGLILALIIGWASIAKANHYPGGGLLMVLGIGILLFPYLILVAINFQKQFKVIVPLILGGISLLIYLVGILFVILHWPGGYLFSFIGLLFLLITLFAIGIKELITGQDARKFSIISITFFIISASLIYSAMFRSVGKSVIDGYCIINESLTQTNQMLIKANQAYYDKIDSTNTKYADYKKMTNELIGFIEDIKLELLVISNGLNNNITDLKLINNKDNIDMPNQVLFGNGKAKILKAVIEDYSKYISTNDSIFNAPNEVYKILNTQDPVPIDGVVITWEESTFKNLPLVSAISILSALQTNISTCEMLILNRK